MFRKGQVVRYHPHPSMTRVGEIGNNQRFINAKVLIYEFSKNDRNPKGFYRGTFINTGDSYMYAFTPESLGDIGKNSFLAIKAVNKPEDL